jgi:hypothetical protein
MVRPGDDHELCALHGASAEVTIALPDPATATALP